MPTMKADFRELVGVLAGILGGADKTTEDAAAALIVCEELADDLRGVAAELRVFISKEQAPVPEAVDAAAADGAGAVPRVGMPSVSSSRNRLSKRHREKQRRRLQEQEQSAVASQEFCQVLWTGDWHMAPAPQTAPTTLQTPAATATEFQDSMWNVGWQLVPVVPLPAAETEEHRLLAITTEAEFVQNLWRGSWQMAPTGAPSRPAPPRATDATPNAPTPPGPSDSPPEDVGTGPDADAAPADAMPLHPTCCCTSAAASASTMNGVLEQWFKTEEEAKKPSVGARAKVGRDDGPTPPPLPGPPKPPVAPKLPVAPKPPVAPKLQNSRVPVAPKPPVAPKLTVAPKPLAPAPAAQTAPKALDVDSTPAAQPVQAQPVQAQPVQAQPVQAQPVRLKACVERWLKAQRWQRMQGVWTEWMRTASSVTVDEGVAG